MPRIVADRESITGVRRKTHLRFLWHRAIRKLFMKNRADIRVGIVFRQVKLNGNALPMGVGMRRDGIAGNVAREDRDWIHADFGEFVSEAFRQSGCKSPDECLLDRLGT